MATQVHDDATAFGGDQAHRLLQLRAAVALDAGEDVTGEALAVHTNQHRFVAGGIAAHERQMSLAVECALERMAPEVAPCGGDSGISDVLDELLVAAPIPHQVGDRHEQQTVFVGEVTQVRAAGHLATIEHQLAQHAGRSAAGQAGQVDRRFGVARALQHAARASAEREDVTGTVELGGADLGVGERSQRGRPVGRRDPGGRALGEIDADRERSAMGLGVLRGHHHRRQIEFVAALTGEPDADHARGVTYEERDRLRRCRIGGHDQVAFVLAVFVVGDHDDLATCDRSDRLLDGIESDAHRSAPCVVSAAA